MIYDRPVAELMRDVPEALAPTFTVADIVAWFGANYPKIKHNTITAHIRGLTSNDPNRRYYPSLAHKPPVFFRLGPGQLRAYDPDTDIVEDTAEPDETAEDHADTSEQDVEFVLESELEGFLLGNWAHINWARPLQVWQSEGGISGHQFSTAVGKLDFLCVDPQSNALVVVELKRGLPSDKVVGQIARYMGWVRTHLAKPGQPVEGLIVAHDSGDPLRYAVSAIPGVRLMTYAVKFELSDAPGPPATASTADPDHTLESSRP